jgi:two-component system response regulator AtoC
MLDRERLLVVGASKALEGLGDRMPVHVIHVAQADAAHEAIDSESIDLLVIDADATGSAGFDLLATAREGWPSLPILIVQVGATLAMQARAVDAGADDVIISPSSEEVVRAVQQALTRVSRLKAFPDPVAASSALLGSSKLMRGVISMVERVAPTAASILVRGESGTGKELVAREVHRNSLRATNPFIKIDCTSLPDSLLESELFGHERGAFTGAAARKLGRVELAHGGTLFLDEVGELTRGTQAKLLRLLQDREFERLGGTKTIGVDVRVIAATHRDLEGMVDRADFREDLFYRLNVLPLWLPPLRARRDDIELLAVHFMSRAAARNRREALELTPAALRFLRQQRWPGNVRQLQNVIERLAILAAGPEIDEAAVRQELERPLMFETEVSSRSQRLGVDESHRPSCNPGQADSEGGTHAQVQPAEHLSQILRDAERDALSQALQRARGNRTLAARVLGISRSTLYAKLREYGLL